MRINLRFGEIIALAMQLLCLVEKVDKRKIVVGLMIDLKIIREKVFNWFKCYLTNNYNSVCAIW